MRAGRVLIVVGLLVGAVNVASASAEPPLYHPSRVLVAFEPGTSPHARAAAHAAMNARVENTLEWMDLDLVSLPRGIDPPEAAARYERDPHVRYAEPDFVVSASGTPNDPRFNDLWGLHNTGQLVSGSFVSGKPDADIDAPEGWDAAYGSGAFPSTGGSIVGVIDSGILTSHADVQGKVSACARATSGFGTVTNGSCPDDNGHGTHVAGTIAAVANNGVGVAGVAPDARLAVVKILDSNGDGYTSDAVGALRWLRQTAGAKVINMSWGSSQSSSSLASEVSATYSAGVLLVAAAGNNGNSTLIYPAAYSQVISVGAIDAADRRASFSNCNSSLELAGPGVDIWSTYNNGGYARASGTSMASPHVAGVGALVMSEWGLTNTQARDRMTQTAVDLGTSGKDTCFGYGRVNLAAALAGLPPSAPTITSPAQNASIGSSSVNVAGAGPAGATIRVREGGAVIGTATASSSGAWNVTITFAEGSHTITATAELPDSGESDPSAPRAFTVDLTPPAAPTITSPAEAGVVNATTVGVSGTAEAGSTVRVLEAGQTRGTALAGATGAWSTTITVPEGPHTITAIARDAAGNDSPASDPRTFVVDAPPPPPVITSPPQDGWMPDPNVTVTGTAQPGATIAVSEEGATLGSTTAAADGTWSVQILFADGFHTIAATASDAGGTSAPTIVTFLAGDDSFAPNPPVITSPAEGGFVQRSLAVQGTAEIGTTVRVYEGTALLATTVAGDDGSWSASLSLNDGVHGIAATATDGSGNTSARSAVRSFTVDTSPPIVAVDGGGGVIVSLGAPRIVGNAWDNRGVVRVELRYNNRVFVFDQTVAATCERCAPTATEVAWTSRASSAPGGRYDITVVAIDAAGNRSSETRVSAVWL